MMSVVNPDMARYGGWTDVAPCRRYGDVNNVPEIDAMEDDGVQQKSEPWGAVEVCSSISVNKSLTVGECSGSYCKSVVENKENMDVNNCWNKSGVVIESENKSLIIKNYVVKMDVRSVNIQEDSSVRKSLRRKRVGSVKEMKNAVRSGSLKFEGSGELKSSNLNYFVEFSIDEEGDTLKRRLGSEFQNVLVEGLNIVSIKKLDEDRRGKKVKADILLKEAGRFEKGLIKDRRAVEVARRDKRSYVLIEVNKWNERNVGGAVKIGDSARRIDGNFSFGEVKNSMRDGCGGWPKAAIREP